MRRLLTLFAMLVLLAGCSDNNQGGPWSITDDGDAGVSADTAEDSGEIGPDFVGEARLLATALERAAIIARDQNSSLCIIVVVVAPSGPGLYPDVELSEPWEVESIVARPEGCPDQEWPAREGLQPESVAGSINLYQSMGAYRWTEASVDLTLEFPENDGSVPRRVVLDFWNLEL